MIENRPDPLPELFTDIPPDFAPVWDPRAPWGLLGAPLDELLSRLPSQRIDIRLAPEIHLVGDRFVIGRGTRIGPGAVLEGPLWIGCDVEIRPGAYLRGGCWIGDGAVIGAHSEIKRAILLPGARAPHLNYVGDSILGRGVNLGAGTILSNFRHDADEIRIPAGSGVYATGMRKMGAILGDGVLTGCNCVLNPGVVIGRGSRLYPGLQLRPGLWPAGSIVKLHQELEVVTQQG